MLTFLKGQIDKKINYLSDSDILLKEYNEENEIIKGYNGRQILELLQNCDDQGSTEVLIKLETDSNTLSISNNGTPFSERGYKSLFMPFRSSKISKKDYIGNKGLGFRSIINWSEQIEIQSNNISLQYNQENRKNFFHSNFDEMTRQNILNEEGLIESAIPVPFLSIPQVDSISQNPHYVTSIIIKYRTAFLKNILFQIRQITPETLFFLKNLQRVKFEGFPDNIRSIETVKTVINADCDHFAPVQKITYNDTTWYIFKEEESLGTVLKNDKKEEEFYQIKIAMEENMSRSTGRLYSFFPTNIQLNQPYILHATFDLDSTRNQLVDSQKNKIILEKVVQFTIKVAKYFARGNASYKPLQILTHKHKADTLENLDYYKAIETAFRREPLYPCVDNEFRKLSQVVYFGDGFAKMLLQTSATHILGFHLIPTEGFALLNFPLYENIYKSFDYIPNVISVFNQISDLPLTMEQRADIIFELTKNGYTLKKNYPNRLNLLLDKDEHRILGTEYVFTPETGNSELQTPSYSDIRFMSQNLFQLLSDRLGYNPDRDKVRSRFVSDRLEGLCTIRSFEPAILARRIITETKNELNKPQAVKSEIIRQMNACLFHNFQFINSETVSTPLPAEIPALSADGGISVSSSLVLSGSYPAGSLNPVIFEGIYGDSKYIADPSKMGIEATTEESILQVQQYLLWLGVNEHAVYSVRTYENSGPGDYFKSIHKDYVTSYKLTLLTAQNFENTLKDLSFEKLILWIHEDTVLKKQLYNDKNTDKVEYLYKKNYYFTNKRSYLKYLIHTKYKIRFQHLLIDEKYSWINDFDINYRHPHFVKHNLSRTVIQEILVALGAKDDFNDLPVKKVADIINKLAVKYPDGSRSAGFYKRALGHYKENEIEINEPLQLFADDGEWLKIYSQDQIYFSDKIKIPNRLKKDFPVFNFPPRQGGVDAIKFFGINDLNELELKLSNYSIDEALSIKLNKHLRELKPYILSQRIHDSEDLRSQQTQASICNKIKIYLCQDLEYTVKNNSYSTSNFEYLHHSEQTYYIKINYAGELAPLLKNSAFTDSIAEILALSFDVKSDKAEFRNIIRNDIEIVKNDIERDYGSDVLIEAKELLGMADHKTAFWKTILDMKKIPNEGLMDDLSLNELLRTSLNLNFEVSQLEYESISGGSQKNILSHLFSDLEIRLADFAEYYPYKISYQDYHARNLKGTILGKKTEVKSAVWKNLLHQDNDAKMQFLNTIDKLEHCREFVDRISIENRHVFNLDTAAYLDEYIQGLYGDIVLSEIIGFQEILDSNRQNFSSEELKLIEQDALLRSLLYFEDTMEDLKAVLQKKFHSAQENTTTAGRTALSNIIKPSQARMASSDNLKFRSKPTQGGYSKKPYFHGGDNSEKLKQIGNSSEDIVEKYLKDNNYSNIYKVTEDNDGLHYDIRITDQHGNIKYIEVKTFNNGMFYLSKDEYDFGVENQQDYEIWLVHNGDTIFPIRDFFTNEKYQLVPEKYIVYLEIGK